MAKLTKNKMDALAIKEQDYFVWDDGLPGFGVRVFPSGRKKFVLQYRHGRTSRRMAPRACPAVQPHAGQRSVERG